MACCLFGLLLIGPLRIDSSEIFIEILIFSLKNAFENVVCQIAIIVSQPQWKICCYSVNLLVKYFLWTIKSSSTEMYWHVFLSLVIMNICQEKLTHWGWMMHICLSKLSIIGSDNGLSPGRRQAIIWTSVGILLIKSLGTNFREILIGIHKFSFRQKMHLKMSSGKWRPFCLGPWCVNP